MFFFTLGIAASFVFGLAVGSFLNSVIFRLETGEGLAFSGGKPARSYCRHCGRVLNWFELIPIVSFVGLKGRCRTCLTRLSWQYPLVEILAGVLFALTFWQVLSRGQAGLEFRISNFEFQNILNLIFSWYAVAVLIVVAVYDFRHYIIPDVVIWPVILLAIVYNGLSDLVGAARQAGDLLVTVDFSRTLSGLGAGLGAAAFFWAIVAVSRGRWLGLGDVKLALLMGLVLGWPRILPALVVAFWTGAIAGGILFLLGRKQLKSPIPFGPALAFGMLTVMLFGTFVSEQWWAVRFLFGP
ncbi:prepilin peptidase [Candidatus Parcubacteria bacterium]|nr:prepilin peptidase [Candidatus Parcubacteria bacterium]